MFEKLKEESFFEICSWIVAAGLVVWLGYWVSTWWKPNLNDIGAYLNVKIPSSIIGVVVLPTMVWLFDIISPGSWIRKAAEDSLSSAIVLASLVIGFALILSK